MRFPRIDASTFSLERGNYCFFDIQEEKRTHAVCRNYFQLRMLRSNVVVFSSKRRVDLNFKIFLTFSKRENKFLEIFCKIFG